MGNFCPKYFSSYADKNYNFPREAINLESIEKTEKTKMKLTYTLRLLALPLALSACGQEGTTREENTETEQYEDNQSTDIATQTEEAFSSISNDLGLNSSLGLMLSASLESETTIERNCEAATETDGATVVNISREHKKSFTKPNGDQGAAIIGMNMTRTWTKEGGTVPCNENQTHIELDLSDFEGVSLETELINKGFSRTLSKMNSENELVNFIHSRDTSGTRSIVWNSVSEEEGIITHSKSVSMNLTTSVKKPQKDSTETQDIEFSIKTGSEDDSEQPLAVSASFDAEHKWISKTIESGQTVGTSLNKTITLSFDMVKFERDFDCDPVSGVISGTILSEEGEGEAQTQEFVLNYTDDLFTLNGETFDRPDTELCEFAAGSRHVKKVAKARQQMRKAAKARISSLQRANNK